MACKLTRKSKEMWLIGREQSTMSGNKLPSKQQTMALFFHLHLSEKMTVRDSATETSRQVLEFWARARIPTQRKQHVVATIEKLFHTWQKLRKNENNKSKRSSARINKEINFKNSLTA